jgi:hypothetical protein
VGIVLGSYRVDRARVGLELEVLVDFGSRLLGHAEIRIQLSLESREGSRRWCARVARLFIVSTCHGLHP